MTQRLTTARTILRPFELSDAPAAFSWFSDPEVMRYIPSPPDATPAHTAERIARYLEHEKNHGFSKWIILDAESGTPIGDSGFYTLDETGQPELGYRLTRSAWGRGLATEVATAWLNVAASWYGFREVFAYAHPDNAASLHVIEKLGFVYSHSGVFHDMPAPLYRLALPLHDTTSATLTSTPTLTPHMSSTALHIPTDAGATFNILGNTTTVKVTGADSGGSYVLYDQILNPGSGVPPHIHTREDEIFFVLEGEVEFLANDQVITARAGDVVHAPRDVPHAYKGVGATPARLRFMAMPAEIEGMFAQLASWPSDQPPDMTKLAELCGTYGIRFA